MYMYKYCSLIYEMKLKLERLKVKNWSVLQCTVSKNKISGKTAYLVALYLTRLHRLGSTEVNEHSLEVCSRLTHND